MRLTIGKKLGGTIFILLLIVFILGLISYNRVSKINDSIGAVINVEEPTSAAAYEMEINLVETSLGLISYLKDSDPQHLENLKRDMSEFEHFQQQYYNLCTTDKGRDLGVKIQKEFDKIKALITQLLESDALQTGKMDAFLKDFDAMDALLDDKIQTVIQPDVPQAYKKLEASMEMEVNNNGMTRCVGSFLRTHKDIYITNMKRDIEDFRVFLKAYHALNLTANERKWANEMGALFETNTQRAEEIVALEKKEIERVNVFMELRRNIDSLLDNEIQVLTASDLKGAETRSVNIVKAATILIVILTILGIAIGSFTGYRLTRAITIPIVKLSRWASRIAGGNLEVETVEITDDEIGDLNNNFKSMVENLREFADQNVTAAQNLNTTSAEILAAIQQQASSTKEQAVSIQETTTTMEEVNQTGGQISEKAKDVAQAAEATVSSSIAGIQAVEETNRIMESIKEQVELMAENIVVLSEKTQVIGEIIANVNDIAEQSNLLALNAAIEAVGAGEQGQRFSVVANEIKKLADRAKESTIQVRTILGEIQKGINTSVMATEEAVKRADTGKAKSDVASQTIKQLSDTVQESVRVFQQIVGATNQQQIGLEQVTEALQNIRTATEQTAASVGQLEKAVSNLNDLSQSMNQIAERYKA